MRKRGKGFQGKGSAGRARDASRPAQGYDNDGFAAAWWGAPHGAQGRMSGPAISPADLAEAASK